MERIKEAVQRARQERSGNGAGFGRTATASLGSVRDAATQDVPSRIVYSKTRVVELSPPQLRDKRIVSGFEQSTFTEAFRILATQVSHTLRKNAWSTLAITSPNEREGKTLVAINLAISLAQEYHHSCILVEADMRQPSACEYFGLPSATGLSDYLASEMPLEQLLFHPDVGNLVVLPGGTATTHSSELLGSRKMAKLVRELKTRYESRIAVFDLPPLLAAADVLAFAPNVDAVLLVVEEAATPAEDVRRAADMLGATPIIGTVLNKSFERMVSAYGVPSRGLTVTRARRRPADG